MEWYDLNHAKMRCTGNIVRFKGKAAIIKDIYHANVNDRWEVLYHYPGNKRLYRTVTDGKFVMGDKLRTGLCNSTLIRSRNGRWRISGRFKNPLLYFLRTPRRQWKAGINPKSVTKYHITQAGETIGGRMGVASMDTTPFRFMLEDIYPSFEEAKTLCNTMPVAFSKDFYVTKTGHIGYLNRGLVGKWEKEGDVPFTLEDRWFYLREKLTKDIDRYA